MKWDNGLWALIIGGLALCGLYFWSALRERFAQLLQSKRNIAHYRDAYASRIAATASSNSRTSKFAAHNGSDASDHVIPPKNFHCDHRGNT